MTNFIEQYQMQTPEICDELILLYKASPKKAGILGDNKYDPKLKESTEAWYAISSCIHNSVLLKYLNELELALNEYKKKYVYTTENNDAWEIVEDIKIQYYAPKQGYHTWHHERDTKKYPVGSRHLVFMTYLNDVTDGGETAFYYQDLKIQPKKGLTVIFPTDWTHTHKGITSNTQDKYIITGWYNFTN